MQEIDIEKSDLSRTTQSATCLYYDSPEGREDHKDENYMRGCKTNVNMTKEEFQYGNIGSLDTLDANKELYEDVCFEKNDDTMDTALWRNYCEDCSSE
jgi:hypothetical protein